MTNGRVALIGSGELTPTMVEVHKALLADAGRAGTAFFLDTPAGFQLNSRDISQKAVAYFSTRVCHPLSIASFASRDATPAYEAGIVFNQLKQAGYILMGPGSPTYTVRQLSRTPIPGILADRVVSGGSLALASAAALTAGRYTLPVYEIYKVGQDLHWAEGLDILSRFDLDLTVIPHWNNAEGGNHDTRFCFMGETRRDALESLLPQDTRYLGIDEHTACIMDMHLRQFRVAGLGTVTLRQGGREMVFSKGRIYDLEIFRRDLDQTLLKQPVSGRDQAPETQVGAQGGTSGFWDGILQLDTAFDNSLARKNYKTAVQLLLDLEARVVQATADLESDETISQSREVLRDKMALLGSELDLLQQKTDALFLPLVDELVRLRSAYRQAEKWRDADAVRQVLTRFGIDVRDTATGSQWQDGDGQWRMP